LKKLVCNICSVALGVLASIMAFVSMFDAKSYNSSDSIWAEKPFGLFTKADKVITASFEVLNDGWKNTFKVISAVIAGIAIACVVVLAICFIMDLLNGKKSKTASIKKIVGIVLLVAALLFVIATIIFMCSNKATVAGVTGEVAVCNWFAYLSVIIGFAGAGLFAMMAKNK